MYDMAISIFPTSVLPIHSPLCNNKQLPLYLYEAVERNDAFENLFLVL